MTYRIAHKRRPTIDDWQEIRRADGAVIPADERNADYLEFKAWLGQGNRPEIVPPDVPALRRLGLQALDAVFDERWKARNVEVQSRVEEREVMAEIAIRCSHPDANVAAKNRSIMEAEGVIHGQTADERIAARIEARIRSHVAVARLSLIRQAAEKALATADATAIAEIVRKAAAEMDAVA